MRRPEPDPIADEDLARRAQRDPNGDSGQAAASTLFERYQERVYLWCFRRIREHEAALDVAQEVLIAAYRSIHTFEARSSYSTWLYTIARNRCHRSLRRPALLRQEEAELDELPADADAHDEELARRYDEDRMLELIRATLDREEQLAIWMRCYEGLPVDEITRHLELKTATGARGLLQSARRKLRAALEAAESRAPSGAEDGGGRFR